MIPTRAQIQQDVMKHFALRAATAGTPFDQKGFWRLTIPRYLLRDNDFEGAIRGLVAIGYIEAGNQGYQLTLKGAALTTRLRQCDGSVDELAQVEDALIQRC